MDDQQTLIKGSQKEQIVQLLTLVAQVNKLIAVSSLHF
jgi:hypothetical protein